MKECRVLIFAGTTEGRRLAEYLAGYAVRVHACAATEYGGSLLPEGGSVTVSAGRMDQGQMERLMDGFGPEYVVDATHPYADQASRNIRGACTACGRTYLRLVRESSGAGGCIYMGSLREAVGFLKGTKGNILAATGSKELEVYTSLEDYGERLYARVLSVADVAAKCERLGIRGRHLICMQGPFSVEMNTAVLREYRIEWLVTKDSGRAGGFPEKCEAAKRAGARLIVIGRPEEADGYTLEEMCRFLKERLGLSGQAVIGKRKISVVGIGTGHRDYLTVRAQEILRQADFIVGAKRIVKAAGEGQDTLEEYRPERISLYLKEHPEYRNVAVALSGDVGFFSGAKRLLAVLRVDGIIQEDGLSQADGIIPAENGSCRSGVSGRDGVPAEQETELEVIPGISSAVYFCAKICVPWEDAALLSIHGKRENVISAVRDHEKTVVLVGGGEDIRKIGEKMTEYGYGALPVCVGEALSYEEEKITWMTAEQLCGYRGSDLAVLYICNPAGRKQGLGGIPDAAFIRGNVPMTKAEVRSVSIAKLGLREDSVVYDIGAGTGSVAVEAALRAVGGTVYAIEAREEAAELIAKNRQKFKTDNLYIVQGHAPEAMEGLLPADCVFIGGSGGRLREILHKITGHLREALGDFRENAGSVPEEGTEGRSVHVVINAISLETLSEAVQCIKELKDDKEIAAGEEEIVQLFAAKSKAAGEHHMMMGQNPVFVISFQVRPKGYGGREVG